VKTALVIALLACSAPLAWAQQPFNTDDADVTPKGKVHIESFDEYDWLRPSHLPHQRQNTLNMKINYGLGRGLELDLDGPLITIINDATVSPRRPLGLGDTNFGVQIQLSRRAHPIGGARPRRRGVDRGADWRRVKRLRIGPDRYLVL
jgi:hypothetical protein